MSPDLYWTEGPFRVALQHPPNTPQHLLTDTTSVLDPRQRRCPKLVLSHRQESREALRGVRSRVSRSGPGPRPTDPENPMRTSETLLLDFIRQSPQFRSANPHGRILLTSLPPRLLIIPGTSHALGHPPLQNSGGLEHHHPPCRDRRRLSRLRVAAQADRVPARGVGHKSRSVEWVTVWVGSLSLLDIGYVIGSYGFVQEDCGGAVENILS